MELIKPGEVVVMFYYNEPSVIVGRNQVSLRECHFEAMRVSHVKFARRFSGGGAVYHDSGNLNYTVIAHKHEVDVCQVFKWVIHGFARLGIPLTLCAKNGLWYGDNKVSGTAFCFRKDKLLHHGTLLLHADLSNLSSVLDSPLISRISSGSIMSNRSSVLNLGGVFSDLTAQAFKYEFLSEVQKYLKMGEVCDICPDILDKIDDLTEKYRSFEWLIGEDPPFWVEVGGGRLRFYQGRLIEMEKMDSKVDFINILVKNGQIDIFEVAKNFEEADLTFLSEEKMRSVASFVKEVKFFDQVLKKS